MLIRPVQLEGDVRASEVGNFSKKLNAECFETDGLLTRKPETSPYNT